MLGFVLLFKAILKGTTKELARPKASTSRRWLFACSLFVHNQLELILVRWSDPFLNPLYERSGRALFRFVEHEDSETHTRTFAIQQDLVPNRPGAPRLTDHSTAGAAAPQTERQPLRLPAQSRVDPAQISEGANPASAVGTQHVAAEVAGKDVKLTSIETPAPTTTLPPAGSKRPVSESNAKAGGKKIKKDPSASPEAPKDAAKALRSSETSMKTLIAHIASVSAQATQIKDNILKIHSWAWLQQTPVCAQLTEEIKAFDDRKDKYPIIKSLLLNACDLGHLSACVAHADNPYPLARLSTDLCAFMW